MSKQQRGMPRNILRRTSPEIDAATEGQTEVETQGRGELATDLGDDSGSTRGKQARGKPAKKEVPSRDIKIVKVPLEVCKRLDLDAIETGRTQSEVVIELLKRYLPNRYISTKGEKGEQARAGEPTPAQLDQMQISGTISPPPPVRNEP